MSIEVEILNKCKMAYGSEVEVSYTCPHCGGYVTEWLCFSGSCENYIADVSDHECPECGESNDLDVDFY